MIHFWFTKIKGLDRMKNADLGKIACNYDYKEINRTMLIQQILRLINKGTMSETKKNVEKTVNGKDNVINARYYWKKNKKKKKREYDRNQYQNMS